MIPEGLKVDKAINSEVTLWCHRVHRRSQGTVCNLVTRSVRDNVGSTPVFVALQRIVERHIINDDEYEKY